jgi:hypothetical protein
MRSRLYLLLGFLFLLTLFRLILAGSYELSPDEAYYYFWAQHPDICYYSKGPGVALAILASTTLFGATEFGVRFFSPFLGLGTSLLVYLLAFKLYREKVAFWTVITLNLIPIFNVGSIVMTIDTLSIFFWTAALYTTWIALEKNEIKYWLLTGLCIGLGFLSKYTNAFQLLSILILLVSVKKFRLQLLRPGFYLMLLVFAFFLLPPVIWNSQHDWITMAHLSARGALDRPLPASFSEFLKFLGGQIGVYSPLLFIGFFIALFTSIRKSFRNSKVCFLISFCWPLLLTYCILAFRKAGEPNWTAPGFVSLGILATSWWLDRVKLNKLMGSASIAALIVGGLLTIVSLNTDLVRTLGIPLSYSADPSSRLRGWKTDTERIEEFRNEFEKLHNEKVFLIGNKYQTSSMIGFYLKEKREEGPGHPPVYIPESQDFQNEYSFWPRYDQFIVPKNPVKQNTDFTEQTGVNPFIDRDALYITDRPESSPPSSIQNAFSRWELVKVFQLDRRNLPLRQIRVFACYQYQTLPL